MRGALRCTLSKPWKNNIIRTRYLADNAAPVQSQKNSKNRSSHKEIIFSGIQPTGVPHLGNYLGALRRWKDYQDQNAEIDGKRRRFHQIYYSVVDLHALTGKQTREEMQQSRNSTFASFLAIGLDPKLCVMFMQSDVNAHSELMWILSTVASTGYLSRMTQWKSKLDLPENVSLSDDKATAKLKLGLFSYPVLQAADILLYRTTLVPIGEDQRQHVEFTRDLARSFNSVYCNDLAKSPLHFQKQMFVTPAKRIMSLRDPTSKMSKSHTDPRSRILITDSQEEINAKIKVAVTDSEEGISFDPDRRPGISNLVEILKHVTRSTVSCEDIAAEHQNLSMRGFKELVAEEIIKALDGFRDNYLSIMDPKKHELEEAMNNGRKKALAKAGATMADVRKVLGFQNIYSSKEHISGRST